MLCCVNLNPAINKRLETFAKKQFKFENICVSSFPRRRESSRFFVSY